MKRLMLSAAAAALLCAPVAAGAADYTFALVPKNVNNPFFDVARDGCKKAEEELGGKIECLYIGPGEHGGGEDQLQMVNDLITRQVDGIAVSPSNAAGIVSALVQAKAADIPVLTWDSDLLPENQDLRIAYIGTKNYDIGVNLAKLVQEIKPDGGTICLQTGGAAAANHNERLQGIRDTLGGMSGTTSPGEQLTGQNGWTEVDGCPLYTDDDAARAVQQMEDVLAKYPDLDAYISTGAFTQWNPDAYRSVATKVKDRIDDQSLALVVADTLPMQMDLLKEGLSHGQVGQRPFQMGYETMNFLLGIVEEGKNPEDPTYTGLDVCTPDNADSCIGG
jgi:ribose transport system substrate-binding protein